MLRPRVETPRFSLKTPMPAFCDGARNLSSFSTMPLHKIWCSSNSHNLPLDAIIRVAAYRTNVAAAARLESFEASQIQP